MRKTALHDVHVALGARMVDFAGWSMPLQYGSILDEVRTVRSAAGLFDLGHMGRFRVEGPDAVRLVERVVTNHVARIPAGAIRYALLLREDGFPLDDLLVYREETGGVFLVVNAANAERDLAWIRRHTDGLEARVEDETADTAMLAVQGPRAVEVLQRVVEGLDLASVKYYRFGFGRVCGIPGVRLSRTGYTGEDGFEVYLPAKEGPRVWRDLAEEAGAGTGIRPIGLAARDTLRLEAGMALYGHEVDEEHHPLEAGLGFAVSLTPEKGDFVGRAALERLAESTDRRLVGITTPGPRVPRLGYVLVDGDDPVGEVRSGAVSPTLDTNVATAYVRLGHDRPGTRLELEVKGRRQPALVQDLPFYSRTRK